LSFFDFLHGFFNFLEGCFIALGLGFANCLSAVIDLYHVVPDHGVVESHGGRNSTVVSELQQSKSFICSILGTPSKIFDLPGSCGKSVHNLLRGGRLRQTHHHDGSPNFLNHFLIRVDGQRRKQRKTLISQTLVHSYQFVTLCYILHMRRKFRVSTRHGGIRKLKAGKLIGDVAVEERLDDNSSVNEHCVGHV